MSFHCWLGPLQCSPVKYLLSFTPQSSEVIILGDEKVIILGIEKKRKSMYESSLI